MADDREIQLSINLNVKDAEKSAKDLQREIKNIFDSDRSQKSSSLTSLEIQMKKNYDALSKYRESLSGLKSEMKNIEQFKSLNNQSTELEKALGEVNEKIREINETKLDFMGKQMSSQEIKDYGKELKKAYEESFDKEEQELDVLAGIRAKEAEAIKSGDEERIGYYREQREASEDYIAQLEAEQKALIQEIEQYNVALDSADKQVRKITVEYQGQEVTLRQLNSMYENLEESTGRIYAQVKEMKDANMRIGDADYEKEVQESINATEQSMDGLNDKLKQEYIHYAEIEEREEALAQKEQERAEAAIAKEEERIAKEQERIQKQESSMHDVQQTFSGLNSSIRGITAMIPGVTGRAMSSLNSIIQGVSRLSQLTATDLVGAVGKLGKAVVALLSNPVVLTITLIIIAISALVKVINKAKEQVESLLKALSKGLQETLKKLALLMAYLVKNFYKLGLVVGQTLIKGFTSLISKLRSLKSIVSENLKLMAKWNGGVNQVNKALSNLTSSLAYVKASLATAFAPILEYIEPALTRLLDQLAELITLFGMFMAKLTGAKTFQKAIRVQKDYAKALGATKKELAGFDELNVLNSNGGASVDFAEMGIEDIDLPDWLKDLESLKQKLFEVGQLIGTKLRDWLNAIDWEDIKQKAKGAAEAIASFFKGLFSVKGLGASIGKALGELVATLVKFFDTLIVEMPWADIGKQLGEMFSEFINTVPWDELGQMFSDAWNQLFVMLYNFFTSYNGVDLGIALTKFFQNSIGRIDWILVRGTLVEAVHRLVETLSELITPENFALIGQTIAETLNTVFLAIGTFAEDMGHAKGGKTKWQQFGESIAIGITEAFKEFEPDDAAEAINNLADGLLDMLIAAIDYLNDHIDEVTEKIVDFLKGIDWETLGGKIHEISDKLKVAFNSIWEALKESGVLDDIINMISEVLVDLNTWKIALGKVKWSLIIRLAFANLKNVFKSEWDVVKEFFTGVGEDIVKGICEGLAKPINFIKDKIRAVFELFFETFTGPDAFEEHSPSKAFLPVGENIILGILDGFDLVDFIGAVTTWWATNVQPWFDKIQENVDILTEAINLKMDAFKDKLIDAFRAMKNGIKIPINYMISFVEGFVNRIIDGLNWLIDMINKFSGVKFTNPFNKESYEFGINIPKLTQIQIPRLAQGAVIPPNKQFMAMLGDQKSGTNVEAPLSTIQDALVGALQQMGYSDSGQPINIYLGTEKIYSEIRKLEKRNVLVGG